MTAQARRMKNRAITWPAQQFDGGAEACACCGHKITNQATAHAVIVSDGGSTLIHKDDEGQEIRSQNAGFMGSFAVGPECARKIPKDYRRPLWWAPETD